MSRLAPATGAAVAELNETDLAGMPERMQRARAAQRQWAAKSFKERARHIELMRRYIVDRAEDLAATVSDSNGKTRIDALATEVLPCALACNWYAKNAGKVLGLTDVVFLDHEDSMLQPTLELRRDIAREIRRYRPDVVICQYPMRTLDGGWGVGHPDHLAAGEATLSAVFPVARDHMTFPDLLKAGLEPHKVAEVWIMGHPEPDIWMDVTDHMDTSVKAIMSHETQMEGRDEELVGGLMREGRRRAAQGKGMQYAESFKRINFRR